MGAAEDFSTGSLDTTPMSHRQPGRESRNNTASLRVGHPVAHGFSLLFLPLSFDCLFKEPRGRERKGFVREGQTDGRRKSTSGQLRIAPQKHLRRRGRGREEGSEAETRQAYVKKEKERGQTTSVNID